MGFNKTGGCINKKSISAFFWSIEEETLICCRGSWLVIGFSYIFDKFWGHWYQTFRFFELKTLLKKQFRVLVLVSSWPAFDWLAIFESVPIELKFSLTSKKQKFRKIENSAQKTLSTTLNSSKKLYEKSISNLISFSLFIFPYKKS